MYSYNECNSTLSVSGGINEFRALSSANCHPKVLVLVQEKVKGVSVTGESFFFYP